MKRLALASAVAVVAVLTMTGCEPPKGAPVPDTVIDFEQEPGGSRIPPFTTADSPYVHFRTLTEGHLYLDHFDGGGGNRALQSSDAGMVIDLDRPSTRMSLRFGGDDPALTGPGDQLVLTAFRGTKQVGRVSVAVNSTTSIDQSVSFGTGPLFDRAVVRIATMSSPLLIVDDLVFGPLCTKAGTEGPDTLVGTGGDDVLCGGGGADTIEGRGGNDHITGGRGDDDLRGEGGHDFIAGNFDEDEIDGGPGNDLLEGGEAGDQIVGGTGADELRGGPGLDGCFDDDAGTIFTSCDAN